MSLCVVCKEFYPPGFTEPIPGTKYHKCKFCEQGKDSILSPSRIDGGLQWDVKSNIVNQYRDYLNHLVKDREARANLIRGTQE